MRLTYTHTGMIGTTSIVCDDDDGTYSQVGLVDVDIENHYHLAGQEQSQTHQPEEEVQVMKESDYYLLEEEQRETHQLDVTKESDYYLLGQEQRTQQLNDKQVTKESDYYLLEGEQRETHQLDEKQVTKESDYYLLEEEEEEEKDGSNRERIYHVLEMPGEAENDYEDPDECDLFTSSVHINPENDKYQGQVTNTAVYKGKLRT